MLAKLVKSLMKNSESKSIGSNVIIGDNVCIGLKCRIGNNVVIHDNVVLGDHCLIRDNVVIGELNHTELQNLDSPKTTIIGANSIIGSGSIIYSNSIFGNNLRVGNNVVIRECSIIGDNCSIGTLSDIQGRLSIGNNVRIHSKCFIPEGTIIKDYVRLYPSIVITNDLYPPHGIIKPVVIEEYAQIGAGSILLPNIIIGKNSLIGAGSLVTKSVEANWLYYGTPAKKIQRIEDLTETEGKPLYPWNEYLVNPRDRK
jgi:acetyltransferase-like isoleucine patch superfamily enzyme